jgi:hypothetical protein
MSERPPANSRGSSPGNSPGSPVNGPSPALLLARGICRTLDQLGYANLAVSTEINRLQPGCRFHMPSDQPAGAAGRGRRF